MSPRNPPVRVYGRQRDVPFDRALLVRAARAAGPLAGPVEIHVVGDAKIREVNRAHLGHDWATDVCTFPMEEPGLWGEIVVSSETARREARRRGIPVAREMALYVIHGVLHLRGLDDRARAARLKMRAAERLALSKVFAKKKSGPRKGRARS